MIHGDALAVISHLLSAGNHLSFEDGMRQALKLIVIR